MATGGVFWVAIRGRTKKEITIRGKHEKDLWIVETDKGQIGQVGCKSRLL